MAVEGACDPTLVQAPPALGPTAVHGALLGSGAGGALLRCSSVAPLVCRMVVTRATQRYNPAADAPATAQGPDEITASRCRPRALRTLNTLDKYYRDLNLNKPFKVPRLLRTIGGALPTRHRRTRVNFDPVTGDELLDIQEKPDEFQLSLLWSFFKLELRECPLLSNPRSNPWSQRSSPT
jgi:hypothetical protein